MAKTVTSTRKRKAAEPVDVPLPGIIDPAQDTPATAKPRKKGKRALRAEAIQRKQAQRARDKHLGIIEVNVRVPKDAAQQVRDLAQRLTAEHMERNQSSLPLNEE